MIVTCSACKTRFVVSPSAIGDEGRRVRCARCSHTWFQTPSDDMLEPDVLDPGSMESPPEPPPVSEVTLPAIHRQYVTPGWLKTVSIMMLLLSLVGGFIVFESTLRPMGLGSVYEMTGMVQTDGLALEEVDIQALPARRKMRYFVSGTIINHAQDVRTIPVLRISLTDSDLGMLHSKDLVSDGRRLEPGESVPFKTRLEGNPAQVEYVLLDLGNAVELSQRY